jgi:hypothetical protein
MEVDCAPLQSCQPSCDNPNGTACPRICDVNSCICKEGFVRDNNNNLQCIEQTQCNTCESFVSLMKNVLYSLFDISYN